MICMKKKRKLNQVRSVASSWGGGAVAGFGKGLKDSVSRSGEPIGKTI